ncbi:MAG: hypothetical protein WDZ40_03045 [Candidatus Spechtbacterales bacterium]
MVQTITIFIITLAGWLSALAIFILAKDLPRVSFVIFHYAVDVLIFGGIFALYFKYSQNHPGAFATMATAMTSLFVFEFVLWKFISPQNASTYLNFVDWVIPAFIIASLVYMAGKHLGQ